MDLPDSNVSYKIQEYWDERFSKEETFEWCKSYADFKHLLCENVQKSDRILMLGCGNSRLSEDMYNDGYRNITNIDFSPVVIENMTRKCRGMVDMQWMVMDITKLSFDQSSFDVVLEKATLDALLQCSTLTFLDTRQWASKHSKSLAHKDKPLVQNKARKNTPTKG